MIATGRKLGILHQLCLAHGVHLAVTDVLYKPRAELEVEAFRESQEVHMDDDDKNNDDVDELEEEILMGENFYLEEYPVDDLLPDLSFTYKAIIDNVREIIKSFRKSPLRMEYLQDCVRKLQTEKGLQIREVTLTLDIKTRWNSMISMLESFFKVKDALTSCSDMFSDLTVPTEEECVILADLAAALKPVEFLTSKLCEANFDVLQVQ
jgi:hypothetical protein